MFVWLLFSMCHDDVIKWKQFPRYWPFVRGIHRSPVNSPHKGQWRGALMCSLICPRINDWVNTREAGDLRRHPAHCDVILMCIAVKDRWCVIASRAKAIKISGYEKKPPIPLMNCDLGHHWFGPWGVCCSVITQTSAGLFQIRFRIQHFS